MFLTKRNLYCIQHFVEKLSKVISFSKEFYFKFISDPVRIRNDVFLTQILLKVLDPTSSGYTTLVFREVYVIIYCVRSHWKYK
jgi:hypothetical protein